MIGQFQVNVITHTSVGLKCLTENKIQILYDHVDHTRFQIVEMGCETVQLLSAYIVGPTIFVNLTLALQSKRGRWFRAPPPPPPTVHLRTDDVT